MEPVSKYAMNENLSCQLNSTAFEDIWHACFMYFLNLSPTCQHLFKILHIWKCMLMSSSISYLMCATSLKQTRRDLQHWSHSGNQNLVDVTQCFSVICKNNESQSGLFQSVWWTVSSVYCIICTTGESWTAENFCKFSFCRLLKSLTFFHLCRRFISSLGAYGRVSRKNCGWKAVIFDWTNLVLVADRIKYSTLVIWLFPLQFKSQGEMGERKKKDWHSRHLKGWTQVWFIFHT